MRKPFAILFLFILSVAVSGEILQPVEWRQVQQTEEKGVTLELSATIQDGWHVYGMKIPDGGPIAMEVVLTEVEGARLSGGIHVDGKEITRYDETFDMDLQWYEHALSVRQRIVPEKDGVWMVKGYVRYMCCDDQSCLPPEKKNFEFKGKEHKSEAAEARSETEMSDTLLEKEEGVSDEAGPKEDWWSPTTWTGETGNEGNLSGFGTNRRSLWLLFLSGILGGLLALLTPCVWPILPMTVSFFLKRGASRRSGVRDAVLYALSIVVVYVGLGLIVALLFGADALNTVATNAWVNILFFVLFVVFALSFFGLFEIQLPGSWSTALNHQAEKTKGFLSIQLMALVLVIVSFSCTGPIVGSLLVEAATASSSGFLSPLVGMLGFALALAMPFGLCALFPDFLKRLPKSGGWMETVKVILAFLELAMALKFLSVADMVMGWGILPRWLFIIIWALLGFTMALYVLLKGKMPRWLNMFFVLVGMLFGFYMASGLFGNRLKEASAFLPPEKSTEVWSDYEAGMREARRKGVPVFVDFTGWGCVNCRKMEAAVLEEPEVKSLLEEMVVIRLYVDDRQKLGKMEKVKENGTWVGLETEGERWSWLERHKFGANAQPLYVVIDNDGNLLGPMRGYDENLSKFCSWLRQCRNRYRQGEKARKSEKNR